MCCAGSAHKAVLQSTCVPLPADELMPTGSLVFMPGTWQPVILLFARPEELSLAQIVRWPLDYSVLYCLTDNN